MDDTEQFEGTQYPETSPNAPTTDGPSYGGLVSGIGYEGDDYDERAMDAQKRLNEVRSLGWQKYGEILNQIHGIDQSAQLPDSHISYPMPSGIQQYRDAVDSGRMTPADFFNVTGRFLGAKYSTGVQFTPQAEWDAKFKPRSFLPESSTASPRDIALPQGFFEKLQFEKQMNKPLSSQIQTGVKRALEQAQPMDDKQTQHYA